MVRKPVSRVSSKEERGASGSIPTPQANDSDPVCRMALPNPAPIQAMVRGTMYGFCSRRCADLFENAPMDYLD